MALLHFRAIGLFAIVMIFAAHAAAPSMRDEVNLAGTWTQGGTVPVLRRGTDFTTKTFERSISIPSSWAGRKIFLEIETLNWSDVTSIDGAEVGRSTGGWLPHSYDITSHVTPGQTHTLTMVAGGSIPAGWPHGYLYYPFAGLIYDVYLRAYGMVAIRNAEVITSVANKTITVKYEVQNFSASSRTISVDARICPSEGGNSVLNLSTGSATLAAGATQIIQVSSPWANPNLWWPHDPKLYHLCSAVRESGATVDSQTVRFGFRECKIVGRFIQLNGVRVNFRGESIEMGIGNYPANAAEMSAFIDVEKSVNANDTRFHAKPAANLLLDVCDEKGFMVELETAYYQQGGDCANNQTRNIWLPAFVKTHRNHASIVHWSAQNESAPSSATALAMNQLIHAFDGNLRPVWHEEMESTGLIAGIETENIHYPEGYMGVPVAGNVFTRKWIVTDVPMGFGEQLASWGNQPAVYYWQGITPRAQRYNDVTLIHNYTYSGWSRNTANATAITLLNKAYAPVALFDSTYDNLGVDPIMNSSYPSIAAGSTVNRVLVLYNDEFSDEAVTVQVDVSSGGAVRATGTKTYQVKLGYHSRIPCSFQVPYVGGSTFDLVLTTKKGGVTKFTEAKRFTVTGASSGTSSSTVTLGDGVVRVIEPAPNAQKRIGLPGISVNGGRLAVSGAAAGTVRIFDMRGKPASTISGDRMVRMPAGIYAVRASSGQCARMVIGQ